MHKAAVNSSIVWSYDNLAFQTCVLICDSQSQTQLFKFRNQTRSLRDVVAAILHFTYWVFTLLDPEKHVANLVSKT